MITVIFLILLPLTIVLSLFFVIPYFYSGIHYERTTKSKIKTIEKIIKSEKLEDIKLVDLGSGNGNILIHLAKKIKTNSHFTGYEINPLLTGQSKYKIRKEKLFQKVNIKQKNFWKEHLAKFNVIIVFQFGTYMQKLENKITKECTKGTLIISNHWKFPDLIPEKVENDVFVYRV